MYHTYTYVRIHIHLVRNCRYINNQQTTLSDFSDGLQHLPAMRTGFRVLPSNKEEPLARALAELGLEGLEPRCSMYGIFTCIYCKNVPNVG